MKEKINVKNNKGYRYCEVVLRYHNEETDKYYIIYKDNDNYCAAKYEDVVGSSKLDTNLSKEEIEALEDLLNKVGN